MKLIRNLGRGSFIAALTLAPLAVAQQTPSMPEVHQLMREVDEHQKALEKVRENYTFSTEQTAQELDGKGQVKKTEIKEEEIFFVHGQQINRLVKKDGKPLSDHEQEKETERVTKEVEKAEKQVQKKQDDELSLSHIVNLVEVSNPRRASYRGRPTLVFDFSGRKDAKSHGIAEDAFKKLHGTIWIDETDRQIAHCDAIFDDNFHIGGGLLANIEKGTNFHFDQAPVNGGLWLPTGAEGSYQIKLFLLKGVRGRFRERDFDYKRFSVDAEPSKEAAVALKK